MIQRPHQLNLRRKQRGFLLWPARFGSVPALIATAANVVFAFHGDALPMVDSGYVPHGIANYSSTLDTSVKPYFATGSIAIASGTNGARVAFGASDTSLKFGTGSWFMEAQAYPNTSAEIRIFDTRATVGGNGWTLSSNTSGALTFLVDTVAYTSANGVVTNAAFQHIAASYDGTTLRLFVNGSIVLTQVVALNIATAYHLSIGNTPAMTSGTAGRLAEMRIVKGEAVVTAAFTAPGTRFADAGTATLQPQTNVSYSNVVLRCPWDTDLSDVSTYAHTMTGNGGAASSSAQSKFGGASLLMDGTGDYVTNPGSGAEFDLGAGDYQLQLWVRRNGTATNDAIINCYSGASTGYSLQVNASHVPYWSETGDGVDLQFTVVLADVTWTHYAIGRKDGVIYGFADGVLDRFANSSQTVTCATTFHIGRFAGYSTDDFHGNFDDLQIVKGECQLFQSFAVPTAALPVS